jgi:hypothetical protein
MQEPLHVLYAWIEENGGGIVAKPGAQRLEAMGRLLCDHARMSDQALSEALWRHAADAGSRTLFAIEEQLDDPELPGEWKTQLAAWRESPAFAVDDRSVRGRVLAPEIVRGLAEAYGQAMQVWPRLWQHCSERNR